MDLLVPTTGSKELGAGTNSKELGEESSFELRSFYDYEAGGRRILGSCPSVINAAQLKRYYAF